MEMAPLRFPSSIASMPHRRPVHKSARFTKGLNSESVLLIGGCYCEVGVLFLPQWKRFALYGAAATFLSAALSSAEAWDGGDFGRGPWYAGSYTYHWNPHWTFPPREHRKHKARPHDAVIARERKVSGPLLIVVSLAQQKATVFANDGEVAKTPVSTGVPGHPTPLGIFSVIQKQVYHESNLYSAAPMPYMQRITWSGIALHAGVLPGHPASHGCIRMPRDFAVRLYAMTKIGARVVVTYGDPSPVDIVHQALFQPLPSTEKAAEQSTEKPELVAATNIKSADTARREITGSTASEAAPAPAQPPLPPTKAAQKKGAVSIFVSRKDRKLYARYNFTTLFEMPVSINEPDKPIGTHVFTAIETVEQGRELRWNVLTIPSITGKKHTYAHRGRDRAADFSIPNLPSASEALDRVTIPPEARAQVADLLAPGASLIISDNGLSEETDSDTDFVVMTP